MLVNSAADLGLMSSSVINGMLAGKFTPLVATIRCDQLPRPCQLELIFNGAGSMVAAALGTNYTISNLTLRRVGWSDRSVPVHRQRCKPSSNLNLTNVSITATGDPRDDRHSRWAETTARSAMSWSRAGTVSGGFVQRHHRRAGLVGPERRPFFNNQPVTPGNHYAVVRQRERPPWATAA